MTLEQQTIQNARTVIYNMLYQLRDDQIGDAIRGAFSNVIRALDAAEPTPHNATIAAQLLQQAVIVMGQYRAPTGAFDWQAATAKIRSIMAKLGQTPGEIIDRGKAIVKEYAEAATEGATEGAVTGASQAAKAQWGIWIILALAVVGFFVLRGR